MGFCIGLVIFCLLVLLNWCFIYKNKSSERRRKIRVGQDKLKQKVLQRMKEQAVENKLKYSQSNH